MRILIVEDNPDHAEIIRRVLEERKTTDEVSWVVDGIDALDYIERCKINHTPLPDLLLLDIKLIQMDGDKVLEALKKNESTKGISVVMLTTSSYEGEMEHCYKLGASGYIIKPLRFDEFRKKLSNLERYISSN
jgi:CheY-like chemotaxis protein